MRYDAICLKCAHTYDYFRPIADRAMVPECPECGSGEARKVILSAPNSFFKGGVRFEPFKSNLDGTIISCNKDLEEHNKRNNVTLLGEGYSNEDILAGKCGQQGPVLPDKRDINKDLVESIRKCEAGYKPVVQDEIIPD